MCINAHTQNELIGVFPEHVHYRTYSKRTDEGVPRTCALMHIHKMS
jgi:hypothetical protein